MSRRSPTRLPAPGLLIALTLGLGACAVRGPETPVQAAQGIPPKLLVVADDRHHVIYVNPKTGAISPYSRAGFDTFLAGVSPNNPSAIHLQLRGPISAKALDAITAVAVADGVPRPKISLVSTPYLRVKHGYDVAVQVETVVYTAQPPSCPRTSHTDIGDNDNTPSSDYGCSFMSDTALMVADPRDLVRGEPLGETDSAVTSGALERLRDDKVKSFLLDNSFTGGGG